MLIVFDIPPRFYKFIEKLISNWLACLCVLSHKITFKFGMKVLYKYISHYLINFWEQSTWEKIADETGYL